MTSPRFALVGPSFFSYIEAIRSGLERRGFTAEFFDERHANSIVVKILYRIGFYSLIAHRKRRHLDAICERVLQGRFTDVVLIDVEVCDLEFVGRLKGAGVRVHLYMWDSAKNKPSYLRYLHLLDGKASFDPVDCLDYSLSYIQLFAEEAFSAYRQGIIPGGDRPVDMAFCGTLHSNRARLLGDALDFARGAALRVSFLVYFHSRWLLLAKSLFRISNARFLVSLSTRGFSKKQIFELFVRSKYVIDVPHPGQVGLTARTFEALRAGARLITFNAEASRSLPATLLPRVLVIKDVADLGIVDFTGSQTDPALSAEEDYFLSLDRFIDQLVWLTGHGGPVSSVDPDGARASLAG